MHKASNQLSNRVLHKIRKRNMVKYKYEPGQ